VTSLQSQYGTRRSCDASSTTPRDHQRRRTLEIDAAELGLGEHTVVVPPRRSRSRTRSTTAFWRDVDDEGVGGHNRR
jgi:hypothetical protein